MSHHDSGRAWTRAGRAESSILARVAAERTDTEMLLAEDRIDLLRHENEIAAHQSFNYALLNKEETAILGCVYIDPPERTGSDGEVSWWVVDELVGGEMERALDALVRNGSPPTGRSSSLVIWAVPLPGRNCSRCRARRDKPAAAPSP